MSVWPIGAGAALAIRQARLHLSWTLTAAPLIWPAWAIDWHAGLTALAAVACAGWVAGRWHFDDLERGGAEARAARETVTPLRWAARRARAALAGERRIDGDRIAIGTSRRGQVRQIPFGTARGVHGLVLGATGSGKTVAQAAIAQAYVLAGLQAIVVDPKGDGYLRSVLQAAAASVGARFVEWSPSGKTIYNPFGRGGPTEIADKALAGHSWTEPHYELVTQRLLGHVTAALKAAGKWPPTLSGIVEYMDPERLENLARDLGGVTERRVFAYTAALDARGKSDLGGGRDRLAILAEGELGPRLDPELGEGELLDLGHSLERGDVVYIHTDSDRYPAASKLLGAALVIDLVTLIAQLQGGSLRGLVVIDEFAALAAEQIARLFGRARSAGLSILLGTQSLADLRGARPDDPSDTLTEQVLTNIEFALCHRQIDPGSAERLAEIGGTQPSWSTTRRVSSSGGLWEVKDGTRVREPEFVVNPDEFKRLATAQAVLLCPTAKPPAEIVSVWAPREISAPLERAA